MEEVIHEDQGSAMFELQQEIARRKRLEEKLAFLQDYNELLVESTGDCVLLVNAEGILRSVNSRGRKLLLSGDEVRYVGVHWTELFPGLDTRSLPALGVREPSHAAFQASSRTPGGGVKYWSFIFGSLASVSTGASHYLVIARDITEHMLAEKALRQSEEAFRKIFEENPIGIVLAGTDLAIRNVNNALCGMLGFSREELVGKKVGALLGYEGGEFEMEKINRLLRGEIRSFQNELMIETRRRQKVWGHLTTSVLRDGEGHPFSIFQMIENIHERKRSEQQVLDYQERLQSLASELSLSEERERRQIATNLHDRIGQSLAFARLKLAAMNHEINHPAVGEVRELVEQAIVDTRSLTFDLSPPVLYELGLVAAVEWLARKIQQEHGIPTRFHDDGQLKPLDEDFRIVLFQAVRELLLNVVKHAKASHAQVLLRRDGDALRIIIEDDGAGFEPARLSAQKDGPKSFGLFNIRERVEYLGGRMKIRSEPKHGTRVTLIAPIKLTQSENGS